MLFRSPALTFLPSHALPQPQQHLLVHASDMTPRLRHHHAATPTLSVITAESTPEYVLREVLLHCHARPVEYGAIGIHLTDFSPHIQAHILAGQLPLGGILEQENHPHSSAPAAYFSLTADAHMARLLQTTPGTTLYGRCNALLHADGTRFADIVEILPPA